MKVNAWLTDDLVSRFDKEYDSYNEMLKHGYEIDLYQSGSVVIDSHPICNILDLPLIIKQLQAVQKAFEKTSGITFE